MKRADLHLIEDDLLMLGLEGHLLQGDLRFLVHDNLVEALPLALGFGCGWVLL